MLALSRHKQRPLRQVLADSHVAAVAIALLLLWALDAAFRGILDPVFLLTGILIRDIPALGSPPVRLTLITNGYLLNIAIVSIAAAWLLSRWVYGMGPLRSLSVCCSNLARR
jgi:hypothetical protein